MSALITYLVCLHSRRRREDIDRGLDRYECVITGTGEASELGFSLVDSVAALFQRTTNILGTEIAFLDTSGIDAVKFRLPSA